MKGIDALLEIRHKYLDMYEKWTSLIKILTDISQQNSEIPHPILYQNNHRVIYQFVDTKIFCHFKFEGADGMLMYGYISVDGYGKEKDVITNCQYFDTLGNVRTERHVSSSMWNMTSKQDLDEFFFPYLQDALEKSFQKS